MSFFFAYFYIFVIFLYYNLCMKSVILENEKIKYTNVAMPELKGKGAIIKVVGCGLCGSDLVKIREKAKNIKLGHEVVGEIIEINSDTNFKIGDFVALGHHYPCFECDFCKRGHHSQCAVFKATNIEPCGFSEYIFASEGHLNNTTFKIPSHLSFDEASFLEPLACCVRSVRCANLMPNSKVLIIGLGSIGLIMGQAVKAFGNVVTGFDLIDERVNLALKYNFDEAYNLKNHELKQEFDAIFMTSGSDKALDTALKSIKNGGKIVVFSSTPQNTGYANNEIYYRELTIMGSYSPAPEDLAKSMELLDKKMVKVNNLSNEYKLEQLEQAINDTISNKILKAFIKL